MPLETATYISQLNSANPVHGDQLSQDDSHMRLVKSTLLATFPNFTAVALNSTQAQLDAAVSTNTNGTTILADAGAHFKTNTGDGFTNPVAGEVDVNVGGAAALKVTAAAISPAGAAAFAGPGAAGIGSSIMWWSNTLPTGYGTWAFLNGQAISRTTYAALFSLLGTTYGAGDGSTTFNLPDTRSNVPVGNATMGGASDPARLTQTGRSTLGALFGIGAYTLTVADIPTGLTTLNFNDPGHGHTLNNASNVLAYNPGVGPLGINGGVNAPDNTVTVNNNGTGITASLTEHGGNGAHNNVQPSVVCNYIIRIL